MNLDHHVLTVGSTWRVATGLREVEGKHKFVALSKVNPMGSVSLRNNVLVTCIVLEPPWRFPFSKSVYKGENGQIQMNNVPNIFELDSSHLHWDYNINLSRSKQTCDLGMQTDITEVIPPRGRRSIKVEQHHLLEIRTLMLAWNLHFCLERT
jgi:hypothetical protein